MSYISDSMETIGNLLKSLEFAAFGALVSTALLVILNKSPDTIGLSNIPPLWATGIGIVAISCWAAILIQLISKSTVWIRSFYSKKMYQKSIRAEFQTLSLQEAAVFNYAYLKNDAIVTLPYPSSVSTSLRAKKLIHLIAGPANPLATQYQISSFVRDQLQEFNEVSKQNAESWQKIDEAIADYTRYLMQPVYHYESW